MENLNRKIGYIIILMLLSSCSMYNYTPHRDYSDPHTVEIYYNGDNVYFGYYSGFYYYYGVPHYYPWWYYYMYLPSFHYHTHTHVHVHCDSGLFLYGH